jgi:hypothetical protein
VGKGSFGEVWRANYRDSVVAVKLFLSEDVNVESEIAVMSKVSGMAHILDLIGMRYCLLHHLSLLLVTIYAM